MNKQKIIDALFDKYNGQCCHCGRPLTYETAVIDHKFPTNLGGSNKMENLRLLCASCNAKLCNTNITEFEFQQYLKNTLENDKRFDNICSEVRHTTKEGQRFIFDISFTQEKNGFSKQFFVEVKMIHTATDANIEQMIRQVKSYQDYFPESNFILAVPIDLANKYRSQIEESGIILWDKYTLNLGIPDIALPNCAAPDTYDELLCRLKNCPAGWNDWQVYQKLVGDIINALFSPPLDSASEQNSDGNNANRRDFIMPNYAETGYWKYLRERYNAEFIPIDAKNSAEPICKEDVLQVAHYLKEKGLGLFGLIFSRIGTDESAIIHLKDVWQNENKMIVVLNDDDIEQMLLNKQSHIDPSRLIIERIQEFRQSI